MRNTVDTPSLCAYLIRPRSQYLQSYILEAVAADLPLIHLLQNPSPGTLLHPTTPSPLSCLQSPFPFTCHSAFPPFRSCFPPQIVSFRGKCAKTQTARLRNSRPPPTPGNQLKDHPASRFSRVWYHQAPLRLPTTGSLWGQRHPIQLWGWELMSAIRDHRGASQKLPLGFFPPDQQPKPRFRGWRWYSPPQLHWKAT